MCICGGWGKLLNLFPAWRPDLFPVGSPLPLGPSAVERPPTGTTWRLKSRSLWSYGAADLPPWSCGAAELPLWSWPAVERGELRWRTAATRLRWMVTPGARVSPVETALRGTGNGDFSRPNCGVESDLERGLTTPGAALICCGLASARGGLQHQDPGQGLTSPSVALSVRGLASTRRVL